MWRLCLLIGAAWIVGFSTSFACENPDNIDGIIYETMPPNTPADTLVLNVEFERAAIEQWRGGIIEAHVRRVVQGEFDGDHVRVGLMTSSCLYPFIFGTEGLIIGRMREGFEVFSAEGVSYPSGGRVISEFRTGFDGVWFQPKGESIRERRERTDPEGE